MAGGTIYNVMTTQVNELVIDKNDLKRSIDLRCPIGTILG
jgi:hypothetical protein